MNEENEIEQIWTHFYDMHSGGRCKEPPYEHIYIEAPQYKAEKIFSIYFGHYACETTCECCGEDYAVNEINNLEINNIEKKNEKSQVIIINLKLGEDILKKKIKFCRS